MVSLEVSPQTPIHYRTTGEEYTVSHLGFDNQEFSAGGLCVIQDLQVGDMNFANKCQVWSGEGTYEFSPVV